MLDDCYWICANDAGALLRFTPQGKLDQQINVPAIKPAMCAFGGRDLDTLFVTSIRPAAGASEHDGHLFAVRPGVSSARAGIRRRSAKRKRAVGKSAGAGNATGAYCFTLVNSSLVIQHCGADTTIYVVVLRKVGVPAF